MTLVVVKDGEEVNVPHAVDLNGWLKDGWVIKGEEVYEVTLPYEDGPEEEPRSTAKAGRKPANKATTESGK